MTPLYRFLNRIINLIYKIYISTFISQPNEDVATEG